MALMDVDPNPGAPVNIGNPGEFTINELAAMILTMVPGRSEIVYRPLPTDDPQRRRPDIARAKELLGWEPKVPLSQGLQQTADYFASVLVEPELRATPPRAKPRPGLTGVLQIGV